VARDREGIDAGVLNARLRALESTSINSGYSRKKKSLLLELEDFLSRTSKEGVNTASPEDVKRFLVWKDKGGKTQVHDISCVFLGKIGVYDCGCPKRLAAGTVQSVVGQLKSVFSPIRGTSWDEQCQCGNPSASLAVKEYVRAVVKEQARSRVQVKQANPLFVDKLGKVTSYIEDRGKSNKILRQDRYILARDQAFFKIQFFAGSRAGDLCSTLAQDIRKLKDGSGLVFTYTMGKTLGNGKRHEFCLLRMGNKSLCPVEGLDRYLSLARQVGIDLSAGFLFRPVSVDKSQVLDVGVSYSVMYARLKHYLSVLDIYDGETLHSLRGGCAVTLAAAGVSQSDIMQHIGWQSASSVNRYTRSQTMFATGAAPSVLVNVVESESSNAERAFRQFGDLLNFPPAV
jgi:integrase